MILTPEEYSGLSDTEQAGCQQVSVPVITQTVSAVQAVSSSNYDRVIEDQYFSQDKFPSPVLRSWAYTSTATSTVAAVAETKISTYTSVQSAYYTSTTFATSTSKAVETCVPSVIYTVISTAYQTTVATETTTESPTFTVAAVVSTVSPTFTVAAVYTAIYSTMYECQIPTSVSSAQQQVSSYGVSSTSQAVSSVSAAQSSSYGSSSSSVGAQEGSGSGSSVSSLSPRASSTSPVTLSVKKNSSDAPSATDAPQPTTGASVSSKSNNSSKVSATPTPRPTATPTPRPTATPSPTPSPTKKSTSSKDTSSSAQPTSFSLCAKEKYAFCRFAEAIETLICKLCRIAMSLVSLFVSFSHSRTLKVCNCSVCFHLNKKQQRLWRPLPYKKYALVLATLQNGEPNTETSTVKQPQSDPENGHDRKKTADSLSSTVGAEGVFQVILSILFLYGSLLKRLFHIKTKDPIQERVCNFPVFRELENSVPYFATLPGECREVLYDLWQSLRELASEKSMETYEDTHPTWRKVEQSVEEISKQLGRYHHQIEYLKSMLSHIDEITANISEPVKYLREFEQEWNPSWSHRTDILSSYQKSTDSVSVVAENRLTSDDQYAPLDCNGEDTVQKVRNFANQVIDLSYFLQETFTKEKFSLQNVHNDVVSSVSTKLAYKDSFPSGEEVFTTREFLELSSFILPKAVLEEIRSAISQVPEKEGWKQIRSFLTQLTRQDLSADPSTIEAKDPKYHMQVAATNYHQLSKDELVQKVKLRDSQIAALEERISQVTKVKKKSPRKSPKTKTPVNSKKRTSTRIKIGSLLIQLW
ncbi:hypothetical protein Gasu2_13350 [Galdieria sulphuraria]|nr:hypothetical protein Gasu2_13350 [Galdieria sulphuraria]